MRVPAVSEPVGFIGVGRMGGAMAERLLRARDTRSPFTTPVTPRLAQLLAPGARPCAESSAAVASAARIVFASLPTPQIVLEVVRGKAGIRDGKTSALSWTYRPRAPPRPSRSIESLRERGISSLDAPVSGGVAGARAGTLALMVSGPRAAFDDVEPILEHLGKRVLRR